MEKGEEVKARVFKKQANGAASPEYHCQQQRSYASENALGAGQDQVGGTAGRGHKGQKSRNNGGIRLDLRGRLSYRLLPKRGFKNKFARPMEPVNLNKLQEWIADGRIDHRQTITMKEMYDSGLVTKSDMV